MTEYTSVEKPFLTQLKQLGWEVIDQGTHQIPTNPKLSLRSSFREIILQDELFQALDKINVTADNHPWLSEKQKTDIYETLVTQKGSLIEANKSAQELLYKMVLDQNELTGEINPTVKLIDFKNPDRNRFLAINQFRIDTPGRVKSMIIPDIVLFVNGLPLVVIECKTAESFTANPMSEAMIQLWRYANQREETRAAGLKEGEERLFHFNQWMIATDGEHAQYGTITSLSEQYFHAWRSIYPEAYQTFSPPLGKIREQEMLIQGMLPKETLLDIVRCFIVFKQEEQATIKIAPLYQQYRAVGKMIRRLQIGKTPEERSGVIWHTQGSGKSLTMVFLVRKLRQTEDLKDFKVVMTNDRTDLEEQLSGTATLTGETVYTINSRQELKQELNDDRSNLNMVMMHKFQERETSMPDYWQLKIAESAPPKYIAFDIINSSDRILILIDEAHRTQSSDLGNNLFFAFPHATRIAFTGTPLITDRHKEKTVQRFGGRYMDTYKLQDAVDDGATVAILYEGKTADTAINAKYEFDRKFEDLFKDRTPAELTWIKQKYGALGDIFEAEGRIQAISNDIVEHYITKIFPNGMKAQVVCHSKNAAVTYEKCLRKSLKTFQAADGMLLNVATIISSDGTNERAVLTEARKRAKEANAVSNFKKAFDPAKPETGMAFLVVCDMLLTGFDVPIEQVMYLDKKITEHNLLQAIARVNRVYPGKTRGLIVDYVGLARHLKQALSIYSSEEQQEILDSFKGVEAEFPILEARYKRLLNLFEEAGISRIKDFVEQRIEDSIEECRILDAILDSLEDLRRRETFTVYLKKFISSLDIIMPNLLGRDFFIPTKRFGYIHAKARQRFKDDSISIAGCGEKVRKLIDEHLISLGINPKIPPTELLSETFTQELNKNQSSRAKASEMEHAIRKHCKIHLDEDPAFYKALSERLDVAIQQHKQNWDQLLLEFSDIREQAKEGRKETSDGIKKEDAPFFDLINLLAFDKAEMTKGDMDIVKDCVRKMLEAICDTIDIINFWNNFSEIKKLRATLTKILLLSDNDELIDHREKIVTEILALAEKRHNKLLQGVSSDANT